MANLQSQIDILAKAVVNEHVRVSNLQTVSVSDVTSKVPIYDMYGNEVYNTETSDVDCNHQVYELKDRNEIIGTFFGYNNSDKLFSGIWCYDNESDYVIDQYGDIVSCKNKKLTNLVNKTYVRRIGLKDEEYDKTQSTKNENRMVYIDSETMNVNIGGDIVTYNIDTLEIDETNTNYVGCICLDFGNNAVFVLNKTTGEIKYLSNGYTVSKDDNGNIIFISTNGNYVYYKSSIIDDTYKTNLKGAIINKSATSIVDDAFSGCIKLESVTIGNSVETISEYAFDECTSLISVTIPDSVKIIGNSAFLECSSLISVTIGNSVETIGIGAFYGCKSLTSVTIPNSVKTIGNSAFNKCSSLTSVTIGNSVENIGIGAFNKCSSLTEVIIIVDSTDESTISTEQLLHNADVDLTKVGIKRIPRAELEQSQ